MQRNKAGKLGREPSVHFCQLRVGGRDFFDHGDIGRFSGWVAHFSYAQAIRDEFTHDGVGWDRAADRTIRQTVANEIDGRANHDLAGAGAAHLAVHRKPFGFAAMSGICSKRYLWDRGRRIMSAR